MGEYSIGDALKGFIKKSNLKNGIRAIQIEEVWEQLMGKTIATYTSDIEVHKHVLYLTILSAPLKQELSFSKEKIKNLINGEMGENYVKEVVIR